MEESSVMFDAFYYCPHAPEDNCDCRKPLPKMLLDASAKFDIDLSQSFMIGDRDVDMETGRNAGCGTIRLALDGKDATSSKADYESDRWDDLAQYVIDTSTGDK